MEDLGISIHQPLSDNARKLILRDHWHIGLSDQELHQIYPNYKCYFDHYEKLCQQCSINDLGQLRHCDILDAFDRILLQTWAACFAQLKGLALAFTAPFNAPKDIDDFVETWIRFTAESLLLVDVATWSGLQTLKAFLRTDQFPTSTVDETGYLPRKFHARNLDKIGGLHVRWTNLLSEHLVLENDNTQVAIFHQDNALALFLHWYAISNISICLLDVTFVFSDLFPDGLLEETRRTLDILLPRFSPETTRWFRSQTRSNWWAFQKTAYHIDQDCATSNILKNEQRRIITFSYFRDRLIVLKEEYDAHTPQNIKECWHDYRKPAQWWAFWVAVFVFIFALSQVVEGAIQCYKAYHPS